MKKGTGFIYTKPDNKALAIPVYFFEIPYEFDELDEQFYHYGGKMYFLLHHVLKEDGTFDKTWQVTEKLSGIGVSAYLKTKAEALRLFDQPASIMERNYKEICARAIYIAGGHSAYQDAKRIIGEAYTELEEERKRQENEKRDNG